MSTPNNHIYWWIASLYRSSSAFAAAKNWCLRESSPPQMASPARHIHGELGKEQRPQLPGIGIPSYNRKLLASRKDWRDEQSGCNRRTMEQSVLREVCTECFRMVFNIMHNSNLNQCLKHGNCDNSNTVEHRPSLSRLWSIPCQSLVNQTYTGESSPGRKKDELTDSINGDSEHVQRYHWYGISPNFYCVF